MRIAIDARLNAYRRGGIPQYTRFLLTALAEIAREEQFVSFQHRDMVRPLVVSPNVHRRALLTPPHNRFEPWLLPLEMMLARPDVVHFPDFIAPLRRSFPAVVTIHDLAFMHYPQILDEDARTYYSQAKESSARADAVIAVSEATRQDITQFLDIPIEQVHVIYEAAAPIFRQLDLREGEARVLDGVPMAAGAFMLFVSTLEPRKNLPTLLKGLRIAIDRRPNVPYKLVVAGGRGWRDEEIFTTVRDERLADYVLFAGSIGQYDLRWLYNACQFYINPSLYEGFGLPLLEAMACGAACIAAATSSLPEIGGDAAIYVPPLAADGWADAIEELWDNTERQQELGRIGRARAQRFSWMRAARETLDVYYKAAARAGRNLRPVPSTAIHIDSAFPKDLPPAPLVIPPSVADSARPCLRCGEDMQPGELQHSRTIRLHGPNDHETLFVPRAWICPNCSYVEMVSERIDPAEHMQDDIAPQIASESLPIIDIVEAYQPVVETTDQQSASVAEPVEALPELMVPVFDDDQSRIGTDPTGHHDATDDVQTVPEDIESVLVPVDEPASIQDETPDQPNEIEIAPAEDASAHEHDQQDESESTQVGVINPMLFDGTDDRPIDKYHNGTSDDHASLPDRQGSAPAEHMREVASDNTAAIEAPTVGTPNGTAKRAVAKPSGNGQHPASNVATNGNGHADEAGASRRKHTRSRKKR